MDVKNNKKEEIIKTPIGTDNIQKIGAKFFHRSDYGLPFDSYQECEKHFESLFLKNTNSKIK